MSLEKELERLGNPVSFMVRKHFTPIIYSTKSHDKTEDGKDYYLSNSWKWYYFTRDDILGVSEDSEFNLVSNERNFEPTGHKYFRVLTPWVDWDKELITSYTYVSIDHCMCFQTTEREFGFQHLFWKHCQSESMRDSLREFGVKPHILEYEKFFETEGPNFPSIVSLSNLRVSDDLGLH